MTTAVSRQNRTLMDVLVPYKGIWLDIATIVIGKLVIAALSSAWTQYDRYDSRPGRPKIIGRGSAIDGNL